MAGTRRTSGGALRAARLLVDLVLLVILAIGLGGVVLGRVLPALGSPVLVVAGPSMAPAIPVGAAVVLEEVAPDALRVGDVVSLKSGPARAIFTHRIVRVIARDDGLWVETKGDANDAPDPSITPTAAVVGRVALALPGAGYALTLLSAPAGVVFILSTGALLLTLGWALDGSLADRSRRARAIARSPWRAGPALVPSRIGVIGMAGSGATAASIDVGAIRTALPSLPRRSTRARASTRRPPAAPQGRTGTGARTNRRVRP